MNLMKTIRKSFSARLSLQVVMIASMVFGVVFSVLFFSSKRIVRQEAESHAGSELSGTVYQIEDILHQVEAAAKNMEWLVPPRQSRLALCRDPYDDADQPARYRQLCGIRAGILCGEG